MKHQHQHWVAHWQPATKTFIARLAILLALATGERAEAELDNTTVAPPQPRLEIDLLDGSRVIGTPGIGAVPLQTSYAKMNVPLQQILSARIEEDRETASIDIRNGDKLNGVLTLAPIKLGTIFGDVTIGMEYIRAFRVVLPGEPLPEPLRKGLVLYYSFDRDERGDVADQSESKTPGRVSGATWTAKGKRGGAFQFNGKSDYIDTQRNFTGTNELTACGWVYFPELPHDSHLLGQFGCGFNEDVWGLAAGGHAGGNSRKSGVNVATSSGARFGVQGTEVELNRWRHIGFTYARGKTLSLYENGVLIGSTQVPDLPLRANPKYTAKVGASQGADAYWASGIIDEIMIFDRALSKEEITRIYDLQK